MAELSKHQREHFLRMNSGERQEAARDTDRELSSAESLEAVAPSDAIRKKIADLRARLAFLKELERRRTNGKRR